MKDNAARQRPDNLTAQGEQAYNEWRESLTSTPEKRAIYEEESREFERWLQAEEVKPTRNRPTTSRVTGSRPTVPAYTRGRNRG
jgi:hypothetical protein